MAAPAEREKIGEKKMQIQKNAEKIAEKMQKNANTFQSKLFVCFTKILLIKSLFKF